MAGNPEENEPGSGYFKIRLQQGFVRTFFRDLAPAGFQLKAKASELGILFVNTKEGCCDTHYDDTPLFLVPLSETKKIFLAHPNEQKHLTQDETRHRYFNENPFKDNLKGWANEIQARPGDGVIIPSKWLHSIWSDAGTVAISLKISLKTSTMHEGNEVLPNGEDAGCELDLVPQEYGDVILTAEEDAESELDLVSEECKNENGGRGTHHNVSIIEEDDNDVTCNPCSGKETVVDDYAGDAPKPAAKMAAPSHTAVPTKKPRKVVSAPVKSTFTAKQTGSIVAASHKKRSHNSMQRCAGRSCNQWQPASAKRQKVAANIGRERGRRATRQQVTCRCSCGCSKAFEEVTKMWMLCHGRRETIRTQISEHLICVQCWPVDSSENPTAPPLPAEAKRNGTYRLGSKHEYHVYQSDFRK